MISCKANMDSTGTKKITSRILVVEDNPGDVLLLRLALDEHKEDYRLEVLQDGEEALRFVGEQRTALTAPEPCAIVLDWHLPKHDGATVLQAIRQEPALAHLNVIALTTLVSPKEEMEILSLGVRLYSRKPTDLDEWITLAGLILAICRGVIVVEPRELNPRQ
jgi:CheY-like chemotaxis protein